jgi:acyl-CoA synthetase (AMP-forming)/AMP-acid ligase II
VREAAVFGIPHAKWGETPVAAVVLSADTTLTRQELLDWVNEHVGAKFQRLDDIMILDDFPRNVAGKTLKRDLRVSYLARQVNRNACIG